MNQMIVKMMILKIESIFIEILEKLFKIIYIYNNEILRK